LFGTGRLRSIGLIPFLAAALVLLAEPAAAEQPHCPVTSPEQARWLADALFEQGAYQRAGACYEAAGDYALANRASVKALGPESAATERQLSQQREQGKALLHQVQQAFRGDH
jgi:hypothetical protein